MSNPPLSKSWVDIRRALEEARDLSADTAANTLLETVAGEIWARIQAQPDTYLLSRDEFAVFNLYRTRYPGETAQRAVARFWDSYQGGNSNGSKK
ncbi:hypothetical protein N7508_008240 [Penicillium antarcticum]|uniref:uncharacterized protein n=1 Tax=Penicillium antarcticum TaxID=416450 RepID=UPI00239D987A|nr:uncharacterized protein N7508_008240 [Penicillium antarcticum]KAJ5297991.1 hypothetical protein N7508_008240 [Penicillium antarcticum]